MIRPAGERDTEAIADIYNEGIATRLATFETEPRTAADVELWLAASATSDDAVEQYATPGESPSMTAPVSCLPAITWDSGWPSRKAIDK